LRAWDAQTGKKLRESEGGYRSMAHFTVSPDGKMLATAWGGPHTFDVWDADTFKLRRPSGGHRNRVTCLTFSADGKTLFSGADGTVVASGGYRDGSVRLWDAATGKVVRTLKTPHQIVYSVAFAPDGRTLAAAGMGGTVTLWDPATGDPVRQLDGLSPRGVLRVA